MGDPGRVDPARVPATRDAQLAAPTARRARPASASCARRPSCRLYSPDAVLEVVDAQLLRVHPARGDPDHPLRRAAAASAGAGRARGWRARARGPRRSRSRSGGITPALWISACSGPSRRTAYARTAASRLTSSVSTCTSPSSRRGASAARRARRTVAPEPDQALDDRAPEAGLGARDEHDLAVQPRQRRPRRASARGSRRCRSRAARGRERCRARASPCGDGC